MTAHYVGAATPITSPVSMNGAYAEGTCGFTSTYSTATTRHPVSSTKTVIAYAYGYNGGIIGQLSMSSTVQGTGSNPVTADAYTIFPITGAKGYHKVVWSSMTWSDYSTIGILSN